MNVGGAGYAAPVMAYAAPVDSWGQALQHGQEVAAAFALGVAGEARFLADGLMNRNWRVTTSRGVFAVKQIRDVSVEVARRNLCVVAALADAGAVTCAPVLTVSGDPVWQTGQDGYCVFPWLDGQHLAGTDLSLDQAHELGAQLGKVHRGLAGLGGTLLEAPPSSLRSKVLTADAAAAEADRFLTLVTVAAPQTFDRDVADLLHRRQGMLAAHAGEPPADDVTRGPVGWTHGDFQHRNVIWADGRVLGVIDWDKLRVRPYGEEVARTATLQFGDEHGCLDLERVASFVAGYRSVVPITGEELADAVHRLWWKRMTDYWQLEFHYDRGDHSCDHLFLWGERFLHWWTPRRGQVLAAFA